MKRNEIRKEIHNEIRNEINQQQLERYMLDELPANEAKEIKKLLAQDNRLNEKIEKMNRSNQQFQAKYPTAAVVPEILKRYQQEKNQKGERSARQDSNAPADKISLADRLRRIKEELLNRYVYAAPALALVLIALFLFTLPHQKDNAGIITEPAPSDDIRIKGMEGIDITEPGLIIHRKRNTHVELLQNGSHCQSGDLLQLAYVAAEETHGVILSIDGNGNVTLHFPNSRNGTSTLQHEKKILLPNAIELDDAPGFERF
ncbi:MAG: DUF4384 domain-containing protein, partial [bacterium]|nr:DUF4384 domain-containing protein [bacterium]